MDQRPSHANLNRCAAASAAVAKEKPMKSGIFDLSEQIERHVEEGK
jgi:hypothetical protein